MLNGVLLQALHGSSRRTACFDANTARALPACTGAGGGLDVGYGVYDLYDLAEFDQKSRVRMK